jgi:pimeloyl-ACP methyl ester carboxylesterase
VKAKSSFYEPTFAYKVAQAVLLLFGVALGLWVYGCRLAAGDDGTAWAQALVVGIAAPLALVALALCLTFLLSRMYAGRVPSVGIGPTGWIAMLWREYCVWLAMLLLHLPHPPQETKPVQGASGKPLLLVHGYLCNGGYWVPMRPAIPAGYTVYTHTLKGIFSGIADYGGALAARIDDIYVAHGNQPVTVIAHSMGGLAMRDVLAKGADAKVATLITLGTPHSGTVAAQIRVGQNAKDMVPNSRWQRDALAWQEANTPASRVKLVAVLTWHDNIVFPQASAHEVGARFPQLEKLELAGVGHVEMVSHKAVHAIVRPYLA